MIGLTNRRILLCHWTTLLISSLLLSSSAYNFYPETFQPDISYLQKLYDATNGTNWKWMDINNSSQIWNFTVEPVNPCGGWQGVYCSSVSEDSQVGHVLALVLENYHMVGEIPHGISTLYRLEDLILTGNRLQGSILHEFCLMPNLSYLDLGQNQFTGTLPSCFFQNETSQLTNLYVDGNSLYGHLPNVTVNSNLSVLSIENNIFSGEFPESWSNFQNLQLLYMSQNAVGGKIDLLTTLLNMEYLGISNNYFSGTLPEKLSHLKGLRALYIHENYFTGTLPASWANFTDLYYFSNFENKISGTLPSNFSDWKKIVVFTVDDNLLSGTLPASFSDMPQMQQFTVYNNFFSGKLPSSYSTLRKLQLFLVQENRFTGNLDTVFNSSLQKYLQTVDVSMNAFTGIIPSEVFTETLFSFGAFQTCFEGTIPSTICNARNLQTLVLDGITAYCARNIWLHIPGSPQFSSPVRHGVPDCLWRLPNISTLHLSSNDLSGTIPALPSYGNLTNLDLSFNKFVGTIPMELQTWRPLMNLNLKNNRLVGEISGMNDLQYTRSPSQIGVTLSLSNNRLSGIIPMAILHALNIDIVDGNLFTCSAKHQPPYNDPNSANYVCASNMLDISLYCFLCIGAVVLICMILMIIVIRRHFLDHSTENVHSEDIEQTTKMTDVHDNADPLSLDVHIFSEIYHHSQDIEYLLSMWRLLNTMSVSAEKQLTFFHRSYRQWARTVVSVLFWHQVVVDTRDKYKHNTNEINVHDKHVHLRQFLLSVQVVRRVVIIVTLIIVFVSIPVYEMLKRDYGTYTNQFRWLISGAFFSGYQPAIAILLIWVLVLVISVYLIRRDIPLIVDSNNKDGNKNSNSMMFVHDEGSEKFSASSWSFSSAQNSDSNNNSRQNSHNGSNSNHVADGTSFQQESVTLSPSFLSFLVPSASKPITNSQSFYLNSQNIHSNNSLNSDNTHPSNSSNNNSEKTLTSSSHKRGSALRDTLVRATQTVTVTVQTGAEYWRRPSVWISIIALFLNIIVVLAIKAGFIYLLISAQTIFTFKVLIEMALAAVDLTWSAIIVPIIVNRLPRKGATGRMLLKLSMLYFNSIFAPCVVIAVVDSSCFNGIFVKASQVQELFLIHYCYLLNPDNPLQCEQYQSFTTTRYYTPLFIYNYDCYSTIVTNYIPIFLISYTTLTLFVPLVSLVVATRDTPWTIFQILPAIYKANSKQCADPWLSTATPRDTAGAEDRNIQKNTAVVNQLHRSYTQTVYNNTNNDDSTIKKDTDVDADTDNKTIPFFWRSKSVFFPAFILASAIHHLLVLITFGLLCPALAVSVMVVVCATTLTWETVIGRWLTFGRVVHPMHNNGTNNSTNNTNNNSTTNKNENKGVLVEDSRLEQLNRVCVNVCSSPRKCIWIMSFGSALFFAFVLLDMAGDVQGWRGALWAPIAVLTLALSIWLWYVFVSYNDTTVIVHNNSDILYDDDPSRFNFNHMNIETHVPDFPEQKPGIGFHTARFFSTNINNNSTNDKNTNNSNNSNTKNRNDSRAFSTASVIEMSPANSITVNTASGI